MGQSTKMEPLCTIVTYGFVKDNKWRSWVFMWQTWEETGSYWDTPGSNHTIQTLIGIPTYWKEKKCSLTLAGYQSKHCLVITTIQVTQEEITKDKEEVLQTIPPQYHQHWKVFSKHTSYWFPPAWEEDHTIILKEGAPDTIDCRVYCQMEMELEATWQFIIEALAKRVHHRLQIAICIGTFLLEKEGWKTLTHHGLLHIKSMDSTQYIPSPPHWQHPWPLTRENLVHQNGHLVRIQQYMHQGRRLLESCFQNSFWSMNPWSCILDSPTPLPPSLALWRKCYDQYATNTQAKYTNTLMTSWWPQKEMKNYTNKLWTKYLTCLHESHTSYALLNASLNKLELNTWAW